MLKISAVICRALGDAHVFWLYALRELLLFVAALARGEGGKEVPVGGTFGNTLEMLDTATARSQTRPEL